MKGVGFVGLGMGVPIALLTAALFAGCGSPPRGPAGEGGGGAGATTCQAPRAASPTIPSSTSLDPDAVARAAVVLGTCVPDDGVTRNAAYMWAAQASSGEFFYRSQLQVACLAHSNCGCAAAEHCLGYSFAASSACKNGCEGEVFSACGPGNDIPAGYRNAVDCQSVGLRCDPVGFCIDGAPIACSASSVLGCNGDGQPEYCDNGLVRHGPSCNDLGLDCAPGGCVGRGASCTSTSTSHSVDAVHFEGQGCSGATLSACVNGKLTSVDCATKGPGFGCQHVADDYFCGLASQCDPPSETGNATAARCDGAVLEFCNAGRLERVDCTSLGFPGCSESGARYGCTTGLAK